ncbi:MAG TPA: hypothetical protein PKC54_14175, partial [Ferruginibacter sp.]|nr:hypothetical protein [Ferruginibacter sp.]
MIRISDFELLITSGCFRGLVDLVFLGAFFHVNGVSKSLGSTRVIDLDEYILSFSNESIFGLTSVSFFTELIVPPFGLVCNDLFSGEKYLSSFPVRYKRKAPISDMKSMSVAALVIPRCFMTFFGFNLLMMQTCLDVHKNMTPDFNK